MTRVYVGNLDPRVTERDLEDEFRVYGVLRSVWVARRPPGYAFIEFDDRRDALDAIRALDVANGIENGIERLSQMVFNNCNMDMLCGRSYSPRGYSPRGRRSPPRRRSISPAYRRSRSPAYRRARRVSPYANGVFGSAEVWGRGRVREGHPMEFPITVRTPVGLMGVYSGEHAYVALDVYDRLYISSVLLFEHPFLGNEEVGESIKKGGAFDDFEVNGNM
ncbi:hypothetical protein Cgig2_007042 [Carnegiea gigantea]|uniref:RRM domain-containing protein n=2 Tax=Magnoliopsida TaxID=3398 RepID=A0A9Q1KAT2_9CARY|nr:hypothetical protein Cgig2_007042 [Carnegiea gigantea]